MRIGIDMGHTLSGAGTGASGYVKETDKNREVGKRLIAMLQEKGHTVVNCTVDSSSNDLADRVRKANAQTLDLFISLHLNAYKMVANEMGVETYIYNGNWAAKEANRKIAQNVQSALVSMVGWKDRRVKEDNFYVLRETKDPAILIELGFCDSKGDMDKWNTEKIAAAIFKGATGAEYKPSAPAPAPSNQLYRIRKTWADAASQKGAYSNKDSAIAECKKYPGYSVFDSNGKVVYPTPSFSAYTVRVTADVLNVRTGPGTNYVVATTIKKGEVYTIIEEKSGWGKLKSGAGWIALEYTVKK